MNRFERVSRFPDAVLPVRKTANSAGYDLTVAEDIVIPPLSKHIQTLDVNQEYGIATMDLTEMAALTKSKKAKPTLVSTGVKCQLNPDCYLELSVRSSTPLKYWLILANGVGIIDSDYYNNPDNEGHIFAKITNDTNEDKIIHINVGEGFMQGIFVQYGITVDDEVTDIRNGGFGSTT